MTSSPSSGISGYPGLVIAQNAQKAWSSHITIRPHSETARIGSGWWTVSDQLSPSYPDGGATARPAAYPGLAASLTLSYNGHMVTINRESKYAKPLRAGSKSCNRKTPRLRGFFEKSARYE